MIPAAVFLHAFCGGAGRWREILVELLETLAAADIPANLHVGLVGVHREEVAEIVTGHGGEVTDSRTEGWEHVTLEALYRFCLEDAADDSAVLYLHTKGAHDPRQGANEWRRSMAYHVVTLWRDCLAALESGADAAGCHYMPDKGGGPPSHFAGNFWWARSSFEASQPPLSYHSRYEAEFWLGRSPEPRTVFDICPGGVSIEVDHDSGPCDHDREMIRDNHVAVVV